MSERKPVVIVGAGPGIGAATARRFDAAGYPVVLLSRNAATTGDLAAELNATTAEADAGDLASLAIAFQVVREVVGDPGVLVFNALAFVPGSPTEVDLDAFDAALSANVTGALACVQEVVPAMREAGHGTILLTGGGMALQPVAQLAAVGVAKAAQRSLFQSLATELAPDGIHVAMVTIQGLVKTGGRFDPALIAEAHYRLHAQSRDEWEIEVLFDGE